MTGYSLYSRFIFAVSYVPFLFESSNDSCLLFSFAVLYFLFFALSVKQTFRIIYSYEMPSLHLACDELTAIVRCLNSHFRAVSYGGRTISYGFWAS